MERAVALCSGSTVGVEDLPTKSASMPAAVTDCHPHRASMEEIERVAILETLKKTNGDKEVAARILGIGLATLYRRLKDMEPKQAAEAEA